MKWIEMKWNEIKWKDLSDAVREKDEDKDKDKIIEYEERRNN